MPRPEPVAYARSRWHAPGQTVPERLQQGLADQLAHHEGQLASDTAATRRPATAAAAPFFTDLFVNTWRT
ncbi:hypothetical protein WME97_43830 [Sorangium sp. So ce367]|uniref:hypothetical protein n=1 Tax=Sorangium sp. So ce367 TaxID=3133305 RepID=UPI003F5E43CB